jgi:hypothetical protein
MKDFGGPWMALQVILAFRVQTAHAIRRHIRWTPRIAAPLTLMRTVRRIRPLLLLARCIDVLAVAARTMQDEIDRRHTLTSWQ